ncbi:MAG TPA: 50S ribosomal protein L21 [Armatimonadota bacterium]|jgi:large subunit ribosomal protein L21
MYAVIKTGGKQYSVKVGDTLKVEKLAGEVGETLTLSEVLYLGGDSPKAGAPVVDGASVAAEVVAHGKHAHIKGYTYKAKKHTHRSFGHRQMFTQIKITGISA